MPATPALSYVAEQVRRLDRERFLSALFAPPDRREALFALYAFNLELARIREQVSEPMMGHIRLQWWRDKLASIAAGMPVDGHPVAEPLSAAVRERGLDLARLERLIDARERDLDDAPPADLAALEAYAADTGGVLTQLALDVLGVDAPAAQDAALAVGSAWALVGLLRAAPFHAAAGRVYLPQDLLDAHGIGRDALLAGKAELAPAARKVAERAAGHLAAARRLRPGVPRRAVPALLPARSADLYLRALARRGWEPFAPGWAETRPRPLRFALAALAGRY